MSLFKKSNRKFRQRIKVEDSDEERSDKINNQLINENESKINKNSFNKSIDQFNDSSDQELDHIYGNKPKSKQTNSKLSFHFEEEDEECNVFKVKKSSYSRRLAKQSEKSKKRSDNKNKEIKNEKNFDKNDNKTNDELNVIWIKSEEINNKQETKEDIKILTGDEINEDLYEEEDEYKSNEPFHHFRGALERGVIPDAKTIYALKKQRQMARDVDEFIPLDDDEKYEDNRDSRIVRDDDNDKSDDDDEDNERISFAINKDNIEREKAREAFLFAQEEEDDDRKEESEDELERWEREQIKKGVRMPSIQLVSQEQASNRVISGQFPHSLLFSDNLTVVNMDIDKPIETKKSSSIPSSILAKSKSNVSSEDVSERIRNKLLKIKESLEYHERQIVNLTADMNVSKEVIDSCSDKSPKLATQFELYQNISTYVSGLFGCLNDKILQIKKLEERSLKLYKSRSDKFILRRQRDVRDQNEECLFLAKKVQSGSATIGNLFNSYDFGGDNLKRQRTTEREGRRLRRRMARQNSVPTLKHHDGMSSDDEEAESETIAYYEERDKIEEDSKQLFVDVLEDYSSLKFVAKNLEEWRNKSYSSYKDAYVSHCLPRLLGPFVLLELINWNPFEEKSKYNDLEDFSWFETLLFYGVSKSKKDSNLSDENEIEIDFNLIPAIIERIILPRFTDLIENVWDPLSTKQTNQLVRLIAKWAKDFPTVSSRSKHLQTLLHKIALRISRSLDEDVYIPQLLPQEVLENRTNPLALNVINFYQRQFWSGVKLFRNIISWQGIISDPVLQELALDRLLNRYLLFAIVRTIGYSDSINKCQEIILTLPRLWCDVKFPQISQLNQLLQQLLERNSDPLMVAEIVRLQNCLSHKNL